MNLTAQTLGYGRWLRAHFALLAMLCVCAPAGCQNFQLPRIDPSGERIFLPPGAPSPASPYANAPMGATPPFDPNAPGGMAPLPGTTVVAPPAYSAPYSPAPSALPSGVSSPMVQSPLQTPPPAFDPAAVPPALPGSVPAAGPMVAPAPMLPVGPTNMAAPALGGVPGPPQPGLSVNPSRVVAPVGSEVVMIANLCGGDGYMVTGDRVEWMISREGVGSFVSPGERGTFEIISRFQDLPKKVDNSYVINKSVRSYQRLDRGTPAPFDDVEIQPGQAWVTVTSPVEGTTNMTVFAPNVPEWDRRQQSATIHWVDAQWNFPPPAINPVGTKHIFITSVSRQTDGSPITGYLVRYEIVGGPPAVFEQNGSNVIEVPTNDLGQAPAEISQEEARPGTNQINVQVIRPGDPATGGKKFVLGAGTTFKTWTSSDIGIRTVGPLQAAVGATINYRIEVTNPSATAARNVVVTDDTPRTLTYVNSTPPANASPSGQEWRLGDIGPGQMKTVDVVFRVAQAGNFNYCATATADGGLNAKGCATTNAEGGGSRPLDIRVNGPPSAQVGTTVRYEIEVVNVGTTAATGLTVTDSFDAGLEHNVSASPIERDLNDLQPGQSQRFNVTFRVTRAGQLCQQIEVRGNDGLRASMRSCLTAIAASSGVPFDRGERSVTEPDEAQRGTDNVVPPVAALAGPHVSVNKTGPMRRRVGEAAEFTIEITNTGDTTLNNVRIADNYDTSLDPSAATDGYVISGGSLVWTVDRLAPGKTIKRQINCQCLRAARSACNRVTVTAEGLSAVADEACLEVSGGGDPLRANGDDSESPPPITTNPIRTDSDSTEDSAPQPRGRGGIAPAGGLTLSVGEQTDPVRVGSETTYQVVISNKTAASDKLVKLKIKIPENMSLRGVEGPVKAKILEKTAEFEPIAEMRAGESITFNIKTRADVADSGRFEAEATSDRQRTPVRGEESTQVVK